MPREIHNYHLHRGENASQGRISALSGQPGRIEGITSKAMQAQVKTDS